MKESELTFELNKLPTEEKSVEGVEKWIDQHVVLAPLSKAAKAAKEKVQKVLDAYVALENLTQTMKE